MSTLSPVDCPFLAQSKKRMPFGKNINVIYSMIPRTFKSAFIGRLSAAMMLRGLVVLIIAVLFCGLTAPKASGQQYGPPSVLYNGVLYNFQYTAYNLYGEYVDFYDTSLDLWVDDFYYLVHYPDFGSEAPWYYDQGGQMLWWEGNYAVGMDEITFLDFPYCFKVLTWDQITSPVPFVVNGRYTVPTYWSGANGAWVTTVDLTSPSYMQFGSSPWFWVDPNLNNYTNATLLDARYYSNIFETDPPPQVYINGQAYNLDSTDVTAGGQNYTDTLHYSGSVGYVEIQRNATSNSTMASYMWGTAPNGETFTTSYDPDSWQIGALPADLAISFNAISGTPANGPPYVSWAGNLLHFYYTTGDGKDLYWAPGDAGGDYSVIVGSDDSVTATHGGTETAGTYLPASSTFTNVAGNAPISDNFFALGSDGNPVGLPSGVTVLVYGRGFGNSVLLPDGIHTGGYTYQRPDGSWGRKYVGLPANNMFVISDDAGNYNSQLYITQDGESINAVSRLAAGQQLPGASLCQWDAVSFALGNELRWRDGAEHIWRRVLYFGGRRYYADLGLGLG
ncbi:hypothetical protein [Chthoniobacter flavus]|nr:hypothetical protein [Chthoniobacter flavus]